MEGAPLLVGANRRRRRRRLGRAVAAAIAASGVFVGSRGLDFVVVRGSTTTTTTTTTELEKRSGRPDIILITLDDVGLDDAKTPTLKNLSLEGVVLSRYYGQPVCSAARASLMSGLFAHRIGFSRILPSDIEIHPSSNYSIPIGVKLLPEYFRDQGYETHGAGKWNIGHCNDAYLPMARGFDSFVGYFSGGINYVTHLTKDGHVDLFAATESLFERVTDLRFSDEIFEERALSVIEEAVRPLFLWVAFQCPHDNEGFIKMSPRDAFEEGVRLTDARVGAVVDAVKKKKVRRRGDYLVVVHSDNGAYPCGVNLAGTSYPLRGCKFNYFQGGIRVPAIVAGSALPASARGTEYPNLAHHVDWLATLLAVAGGTLDDDDETSSVNHWPFLQNEILNINRRALLYVGLGDTYAVAIRDDGIKLLHGVYNNSDYYDPDINYSGEQSCIGSAPPLLLRPTWLFNLTTDPLERDNLATNPEYAPLVDAVLRLAMDENRRNSYKPLLHFGEEPLSALAPVFQRSANFVGPFNCSLNYYLH